MPVFDGFRNVKQTTLLDRTADFALRPSACRGDVATVMHRPTGRGWPTQDGIWLLREVGQFGSSFCRSSCGAEHLLEGALHTVGIVTRVG